MRVPPTTECGVATQVFISYIVSSNPGNSSIDDDILAVIAKIQLEAIAGTLPAVERKYLDAGRTKFLAIRGGKSEAANFIVEKQNAYTTLRFCYES